MAPQQAAGKRKEDFVKWKDSHATREGGQSNVGDASSSAARRPTTTSRPQSTVNGHIQQQYSSGSEELPQTQAVAETDRDGELDIRARMQRPPPVPKQVPSSRFVPPRTTTQSHPTVPRSTSLNSPHINTRQQPQYTVDDDTCEVEENSEGDTYRSPPQG